MGTRTIALDDFLDAYAPAWPWNEHGETGTWDDALAVTALDEMETERVQVLVAEIIERGLDEAVLVDEEEMRVANGMHRVLAHIALGRDVPVTTEKATNAGDVLTTTTVLARSADDDQVEALLSLVSFRLDETTWVESDLMLGPSRTSDDVEVRITWCANLAGHHAQLHAALRPRLARAGIEALSLTSVEEDLSE